MVRKDALRVGVCLSEQRAAKGIRALGMLAVIAIGATAGAQSAYAQAVQVTPAIAPAYPGTTVTNPPADNPPVFWETSSGTSTSGLPGLTPAQNAQYQTLQTQLTTITNGQQALQDEWETDYLPACGGDNYPGTDAATLCALFLPTSTPAEVAYRNRALQILNDYNNFNTQAKAVRTQMRPLLSNVSTSGAGFRCNDEMTDVIFGLGVAGAAIELSGFILEAATSPGSWVGAEVASNVLTSVGQGLNIASLVMEGIQNELPNCEGVFTGTVQTYANLQAKMGLSTFDGAITLGYDGTPANPFDSSVTAQYYYGGITLGGGGLAGAGFGGAQAFTGDVTAIAIGNGARATSVNSTAIGTNARALAVGATALGANSLADAENATAVGINSQARGVASTATGAFSQAIGDRSSAFGANAIAQGVSSTAVGDSATATGANSFAGGLSSQAFGASSVAVGHLSFAATNGAAVGPSANAQGTSSSAFGQFSLANATSSTAAGHLAVASGVSSVASGHLAAASGVSSVASGHLAAASGLSSVAVGHTAASVGPRSVAVGFGAVSAGSDSISLGDSLANDPDTIAAGRGASAVATDAIAMGRASFASSLGAVAIGAGARATGSTAMGFGALATGIDTAAYGEDAQATALNSTAIGEFSRATATGATALGRGTRATAALTTALGQNALARDLAATASGQDAIANAARTSVYGQGARADGTNGTALGQSALVTNSNTVAVGQASVASGLNASAFGQASVASGESSIAIGQASMATHRNSTAFGPGVASVADNNYVFGLDSTTYRFPGIDSAQSFLRQDNCPNIPNTKAKGCNFVTSDMDGDLATLSIASVVDPIYEEARVGTAMGLAMSGLSDLQPGETFALSTNWGMYEGEHALAGALTARLDEHVWFAAGAGVGIGNQRTPFGARAGLRLGW